MKKEWLVLSLMLITGLLRGGVFDRQLVACWDFNRPQEQSALTDTTGTYRFVRRDCGSDRRFELTPAGTVKLGAGVLLACGSLAGKPEIKAALRQDVTVWMRVRFPEPPAISGLFFAGFTEAEQPADWKNFSAALFYIPGGGGAFYRPGEPPGAALRSKFNPNEFNDIAFTFNHTSAVQSIYINGEVALRKKFGVTLPDFSTFALGRLRAAGGLMMEVDEVRIYNTAMMQHDLAALKPTPVSGEKISEAVRGKVIVENFADLSTWRANPGSNTRGKCFPFDFGIGGEPDPERKDGYRGRIYFDLGPGGGQIDFRRNKVTRAGTVTAEAIEYDLNTNGIPCRIGWTLLDAKEQRHRVSPMPVQNRRFTHIRQEISARTVSSWKKITFPVRIQALILNTGHSGPGAVLIDDIALCGEFGRPQAVSIFPEFSMPAHRPGQPFTVTYRINNYTDRSEEGTFTLKLYDYNLKLYTESTQAVKLSAEADALVNIPVKGLPIGSYHAEIAFSGRNTSARYTDFLAVFEPNRRRINGQGMKFGVMDLDCAQAAAENRLHREWMSLLGLDLVRFFVTGTRLDSGDADSFALLGKWFDDYRKRGIDICLCYSQGIPGYVMTPKRPGHRLPADMNRFRAHIEKIFRFLSRYPNVRYFEWWNEADIALGPADTTEEYLRTLEIVHEAARRFAPDIKILTSGVTTRHRKEKKGFTADMYVKGKGSYDIACFHGHGSVIAYREAQERVEHHLRTADNRQVPVANTETGERSGYTVAGINNHAQLILKKIIFAKTRNTEFYTHFTLQDYWDLDPEADDSFGTMTSDNRPKPVFIVCNELIRQLANTRQGEKITLNPALEAYRFASYDGKTDVWTMWPVTAGERQLLMLSGTGSVTLTDMFGQTETVASVDGMVSLVLPALPCYLRLPKGAFRVMSNPITCRQTLGALPGTTVRAVLTLDNPWSEPAEFGIRQEKKTVMPGKSAELAVTLDVPEAAVPGTVTSLLPVTIRSGVRQLSYCLPIAIRLGVPVFPAGGKASPIIVADQKYVSEKNFDPNTPRWQGKNDLSGQFRVFWTDQNLVIEADITDNVHVLTHTPELAWNDDCIQIGLAGPGNTHYEFTVSGADGRKSAVYCHIAPTPELTGEWSVPVSVVRTGDKTAYRLKLPFRRLGIAPAPGTAFRMAFLISDNDGIGKLRFMEWGGGIGHGKNIDEFNWMILRK